jgi:hypothetical protein
LTTAFGAALTAVFAGAFGAAFDTAFAAGFTALTATAFVATRAPVLAATFAGAAFAGTDLPVLFAAVLARLGAAFEGAGTAFARVDAAAPVAGAGFLVIGNSTT